MEEKLTQEMIPKQKTQYYAYLPPKKRGIKSYFRQLFIKYGLNTLK